MMETKQIFTSEDYRSIMEDESLDTIDLIENILRDYRIQEYLNERSNKELYEIMELPMIVDHLKFLHDDNIPSEYKEHTFILNEDVADGYIEQVLFNDDYIEQEVLNDTVVLLYSTFRNFVVELTNELERRDLFLPDFVFMYMAFEVLFHEYNMEEIIKEIVDEYGEADLIEKLAEELGIAQETMVQYFTTQQQFWGY